MIPCYMGVFIHILLVEEIMKILNRQGPSELYCMLLHCKMCQGCGLRKIMRSPKIRNHGILGSQHLST